MSKTQKQTLEVIGKAKESNAKTATDWAWELASEFYLGKSISNRRIEMYVNAILDLTAKNLLTRTEDDEYYGK
jgi:hypothetical protein